jgi:CDP-diacylglycerol--glycerol-3-phosphate 3-phosphatidyltransferase
LLSVVLSPPEVLIAFRAACAPAIVTLACFGFSGPVLAAVLVAAFLSDVFDGAIARVTGRATAALRHADTRVDTLFYAAAALAMRVAVPAAFAGTALAVALLITMHVSRATFELAKFGRLASYHMWSSKALGVLIVLTMTTVFETGQPTVLTQIALWAAIGNEIEGFSASVMLPAWTADVPSALHAYRIRHVD